MHKAISSVIAFSTKLFIDSPELFSIEPMQMAAVRKLRKDISADIEAVISDRLNDFEENFWGKG
ncbi:hypothetical protein FACS1894137_05290 [Spirochaetia bacterium]|nr:hypothetical protein FACS1894137_05290 [Spirochaetia bacterium]